MGGGGLVPSTASGLMPTSWTNEAICRQVESVWESRRERGGAQRRGSCVPHRQSHYVDKSNGARGAP